MIFAFRDDDTCFFTQADELERAYDFVKDGCISLSVVPFAVPSHKNKKYFSDLPYREYSIEDNPALTAWLREKHREGRVDIMLHGYSHEYLCNEKTRRWDPELIWKDAGRLRRELKQGRELIEGLTGAQIRVFVAPNNSIGPRAINIIEEMGLHYSGIIGRRRDRRWSLRYILNYLHRWFYRLFTGRAYCGLLDFGGHLELNALRICDFETMKKEYLLCKKHGHPYVIFTHYWELLEDPARKAELKRLYDFMIADGAQMRPLSACYGD